ncbi:MAG: cation transporter [bacterium]
MYFWSLVVAVLLFGLGGGLSIYEGVQHVIRRAAPHHLLWSYGILAVAFVAEGSSFLVAWRHGGFDRSAKPFWQTFRNSKDPRVFVPLAEDVAALLGIGVAASGLFLADRFQMPIFDGIASIVIGVLLAGVAVLLADETRSLLLGERADGDVLRRVRAAALREPAISAVTQAVALHLGPDDIVLTMRVLMARTLSVVEAESIVGRLKRTMVAEQPRLTRIFVETNAQAAQSPPIT